ncbi:MAG: hypothetical protein U0411_10625 [Thermodesulfovibrionales bacterium]
MFGKAARVFGLGALLFLSACATTERDLPAEHSQASSYEEGLEEGCESAYALGGNTQYRLKKSIGRYNNDAQYMKGWDEGYNRCRDKRDLFTR